MDERNPLFSQQSLIWNLDGIRRSADWSPFRDGIEIHRLYGNGLDGPAAALIRYAPGAQLPLHAHGGFEHVLVLSGAQSDERGEYVAGSLVVNPPGSQHSVTSRTGCEVLVIWDAPVTFISGESS